jgi:4-hydroxy-tetrahydrodipicolinate synthase
MLKAIGGISAIPITPFDAGGAVDVRVLADVVGRITSAGIDLIVACGNTSEYSSLTQQEIALVTEATINAAGEAITMVGVGGDVSTAVRNIKHAAELGAGGFMIHAPTNPHVSDAGLINYYETLAGATDAGIVLYLRGREWSPSVLERVVALENVVAIKYARRDLMGFVKLVDRFGDAIVPVCGLAEGWAPFFWLVGGRGFTSGLTNVAPALSTMLLKALEGGDYAAATRVWRLIKPFEELRERNADALNVPAVKEAMVLRGYLENPAVRAPISGLSSDERRELADIVGSWERAGV